MCGDVVLTRNLDELSPTRVVTRFTATTPPCDRAGINVGRRSPGPRKVDGGCFLFLPRTFGMACRHKLPHRGGFLPSLVRPWLVTGAAREPLGSHGLMWARVGCRRQAESGLPTNWAGTMGRSPQ